MKTSNVIQIFTFFACILLCLQVASLRPAIVLPAFSYGTPDTRIIAEPSLHTSIEMPAVFTSFHNDAHSILFVGDVLLARHVEVLLRSEGNSYPYQGLPFATVVKTPYIFGNFESAIPRTHTKTKNGDIVFSVDREFLPALREAGFSHFSLANNHTLDFDYTGLSHTVTALTAADLTPFGNPTSLTEQSVTFLHIANQEIAVIGMYALATVSTAEIVSVIDYATARSDMQIMYVHWGDEYEITHSAEQEALAEQLVAAGADLIIGHHPHVVQDIGVIAGVPVLYSLGNFIFDQYLSQETEQGLLVQLDIKDEPVIRLYPVTSLGSPSQPQLMPTKQTERFLAALAARSAPELEFAIRNGAIALVTPVASSAKIAMIQ